MRDTLIVWAVFVPLIAGTLAALCLQQLPGRRPARWLDLAALAIACVGLLGQTALLMAAGGAYDLPGLDLTLAVTPLARLGVAAADAALLCALFVTWSPRGTHDGRRVPFLPVAIASSALAGLSAVALLVQDAPVKALCLFGVALAGASVAAFPLPVPPPEENDALARSQVAQRLSGGLKHVAQATLGTALLVAGGLVLADYPFNLENTGTLQAGLGLLSIGLAVRVGVLPFAGTAADLVASAPQAAIVLLGGTIPVVLVAGVQLVEPFAANLPAVSPAGRQVVLGLAALGVLLAGVRGMASQNSEFRIQNSEPENPKSKIGVPSGPPKSIALLVASSIALQSGWALFGVLSGTQAGAAGAALLAANLALAVPLLVSTPSRLGLAAGAASLLGLPPLGGFPGTLLVAQAAVEVGGPWAALLLLGNLLLAGAWLQAWRQLPEEDGLLSDDDRFPPQAPSRLLTWVLVGAQAALFVLALTY